MKVNKKHTHCFSLCLLQKRELDPYVSEFRTLHPEVECQIEYSARAARIHLASDVPLDQIVREFEAKFPKLVFYEKNIETAIHHELIRAKKTLGLAESCTGGAIASRLTKIPDASYFLLGSVVVYSNDWKETFLGVSKKTLSMYGAVSEETVSEMVEGIFSRTEADFAVAVSGTVGPAGGTKEKPVGTIYIGIGKRGQRSDIGVIHAPQDRLLAIDFTVDTALCALWRRLIHNTFTFS